jgi:hypothetical protein
VAKRFCSFSRELGFDLGYFAVATAVNKNPSFNPATSEGLFNNKTFAALEDGIGICTSVLGNGLGLHGALQARDRHRPPVLSPLFIQAGIHPQSVSDGDF